MMAQVRTDKAVSPVVGVMLMLVVTIILAAVVSAFASGTVTTTKAAPEAVFSASYEATTDAGFPSAVLTFTHKGGDTLDPACIEITLNSYGTVSTIDTTNSALSIVPSGSAVSAGSMIVYNGTADYNYLDGKLLWTIKDKNSDKKIASGELFL